VQKSQLEWARFRTIHLPLILLVLLGVIAYANTWTNALAWDDTLFVVTGRFDGLGLADIPRFFSEDLWAIEGWDSGLYRPLLLVSILLDVKLFGHWVAGYHLTNTLLHVLSTFLVYGFIRHLFSSTGDRSSLSRHVALLAAVIFSVHPIYTEVVNSVFNRSEMLVTIGVVGGLQWFLRTQEKQAEKAWFGLSLIYLLALLFRESAATLPALAVLMLVATLPGNWLQRLRKCIPVLCMVIPLGIYLVLRANALAAPDMTDEGYAQPPAVDSSSLSLPEDGTAEPRKSDFLTKMTRSFNKIPKLAGDLRTYDPERLLHAVRLWAESLGVLFWPHPLQVVRGPPKTGSPAALALLLLILGAATLGLMRKQEPEPTNGSSLGARETLVGLITGLAFFSIALLPSCGIVGPTKFPHLAERFLYLPSVGMVIVLAFSLRWVARRFSLRTAIAPIVILTVVLTPLTWARNSDWKSNMDLAEADYQKGVRNKHVLRALVHGDLDAEKYYRAAEFCERHKSDLRDRDLGNMCGYAFSRVGRYDEAEKTFLLALDENRGASEIHVALASMYLRLGRRDEAQEQFEQSITVQDKPFLKEFLTGVMLSQLYPSDRGRLLEAKAHFERALQLQPQFFKARERLDLLNEKLDRSGRLSH